ncbi:MAG: FadR/GntR family transcriptional regulator [Planctomycetaceae bacterium]
MINAKDCRSASQKTWHDVIQLVEEHHLAPGGRLPSVRELATILGVKPNLIRDALHFGQMQGAVRILPRVGAILQTTSGAARAAAGDALDVVSQAIRGVVKSGSENVLHLLNARRLIEMELAGRAAERRLIEDLVAVRKVLELMYQSSTSAPRAEFVDRDIQFHVALGRLAGNEVLSCIQVTLLELLRPYLIEVPWSLERRSEVDRTHGTIYTAVVEGNVERARSEMRLHLNMAYDSLLGELCRLPAASSSQDE